MARRNAHGRDEDTGRKDHVIQTRVSDDLYDKLNDQAGNEPMAKYLRNILYSVVQPEPRQAGTTLRRGLLSDLYCIGVPHELPRNGDTIECEAVPELLDQHWDSLTGDTARTTVREPIHNSSTIYIAGEGGSLGVGRWLAARLNDQDPGYDTYADACEDIPINALDADDTLVIISRSGTTASVVKLAATRAQDTDATVIGVTREPEPGEDPHLYNEVDAVLPVPPITEATPGPYATRAVFLQMAALYVAVLADDPDMESVRTVFSHVNEFVEAQLAFDEDNSEDDDEEEEWGGIVPTTDGDARLDPDSQFAQAAAALDRADDLDAAPLITGLGRYHPLGKTAAHVHMAFCHTHADHVSVGSTVESTLNVLFHGGAYLLAVVPNTDPAVDPDPDDQSSRYVRFGDYLFEGTNTVSRLLARPSGSPGLRMVAFTFNDPDRTYEKDIRNQSRYEDDGLIVLPDHDDRFANDLVVMAAHYFFAYALLDLRWERDSRLREETMHGPTDRRI